MNLTIRKLIGVVATGMVFGAIIATVAFFMGVSAARSSHDAAFDTPVTYAEPSTPEETIEPGIDESVVTTDGSSYTCTVGFMPVQVPLGQTIQSNGASFTLGETRGTAGIYQETAEVSVTLPANVVAPTMIVNTAAHNMAPNVYPQYPLQIALEVGGTGNYTLVPGAYTDNFTEVGITDVTFCTKTQ